MDARLKEIIISVTNRCTLRCAMCQIPSKDNARELSREELKRLIMDGLSLCPQSIVFSGGEPLLREDIFDMIALVNSRHVNTCLTSNGTLLTDDVAAKLAASGIGVVNISIDGDESAHDALRGKGNYAKAVRALECLAKYKIETTIACIVTSQNYHVLTHVMDLAQKHGVTTVKFQPFSVIFLKNKDIGEKFFAPVEKLGDIRASMAEVLSLAQKYHIATNPDSYLYSIPAYLCSRVGHHAPQQGCAALWTSCPISAEGDVFPCWVLSDRVLGNVKNRNLSDIWDSLKHHHMRQAIVEQGCRGCMMSCYDNNFGQQEINQLIAAKAKKLTSGSFYKRMGFRLIQYLRYLLAKALRRIKFILWRRWGKKDAGLIFLVHEIRQARQALLTRKNNISYE